MQGSVHIHIESHRCCYDFTLRKPVTVLADDGATGKSTLYRLLSFRAGVEISTSCELIPLTEFTWRAALEYCKNKRQIFFTDEYHHFALTKEFADLFMQTGCYLVMITRDTPKFLKPCDTEKCAVKTENGVSEFVVCDK